MWILHDSYPTGEQAELYGKSILEAKVASGVKVVKNKSKKEIKYDLYILPLKGRK
jgi:hypothetical protein